MKRPSTDIYIKLFLSIFLLFGAINLFANQGYSNSAVPQTNSRIVKGSVTDETGTPLPGVSIVIQGTAARGTITDANGAYSITVGNANAVLVFSYVGYAPQEVPVGMQSMIDMVMKDAMIIEDVVVVGYGTQSVKKVTTAISKLNTEALEYVPFTNATEALQGTIPGLRVQQSSGMPGSAPTVVLRGGANISNPDTSTPLYVIDGMIQSSMSNLFGDDFESVQVLKDAASTAIYGARGSNGVIIINTKKGKPGTFNISYSYSLSSQNAQRLMDYASAAENVYWNRWSFTEALRLKPSQTSVMMGRLNGAWSYGTGNDLTNNTAFTTMYRTPANEHKLQEGWEEITDPYDTSKTIIFKHTDFQKLIYQTAISHKHHLAVSGANDQFDYYASLGYISGAGIAIASDYSRYNLTLNAGAKITDFFKLNVGVQYSEIKANNKDRSGWTWSRAASTPASSKYQFEDGTIAPGISETMGNPHYYLTGPGAIKQDNKTEVMRANVGGVLNILPGLVFEPQVSIYTTLANNNTAMPAYWSGITTWNTNRSTAATRNTTSFYQADAVFTYNKEFGKHSLEAKAGYNYWTRINTGFSATGTGHVTDYIETLVPSLTYSSVTSSKNVMVTSGFFGRINYDYDSKYLLSVNMRYDGASVFGSNSRYGFFPGVSAGWNLDREGFWQNWFPNYVFELKLRASYGINGNIGALSEYQWQGSVNGTSKYGGSTALTVGNLPNDALQWEQSKTFDVGFDATFLQRRISLSFDYFNRKTESLLTSLTLPYSTGIPSVYTNFGTLGNKGVEIAFAARILPQSSKLQWNISANAAYVSTTILKLPYNGVERNRQGGVQIYDDNGNLYWAGGLQEGGRIGDMFSLRQIKVFATDAEAATAPVSEYGAPRGENKKFGGDVLWDDRNGDGKITSADQIYVGNPRPDWTGGFSTDLRYKGITLSARFDFTLGHTIFNDTRAGADAQNQGDAMPTKDYIDKMWKKEGDITDTPRYWYQNMQGNIVNSDRYRQRGDFLCFRELSLRYALPESVMSKIPYIKGISVSVSGRNLYYFTAYTGVVPEIGGTDTGHYPIPRIIDFGIKVTF